MIEAVAQARVLDEIGRVRQARFAAAVVLDLQAARSWHVVNIVAADLRVRIAIAVMQRERLRRAFDCRIDNVGRKQNAAVRVGFEAVVEQSLAEPLATNFHARLGHDSFRLIENIPDHAVGKNAECRSHYSDSCLRRST